MARQKGTANFSGTLEVLAGGPIDSRTVVPTLADLTVASNFPYAYVGMETYVVAENKKYRLIGDDVTQSSNWEEVGAGGSGASLPAGGTTGQVLVKKSNADDDVEWGDMPPTITVDATLNESSTNPVQNQEVAKRMKYKYSTSDDTYTDIADGELIPFRGTSESKKGNISWANIKAKLKAYFDPLYGSTSIYANAFNKSDIYSTTEKVVGCWTDGRPVYQKVVSFGALANVSTDTYVKVASGVSINQIVSAKGWFRSGTTWYAIMPYNADSQGYINISSWTNAESDTSSKNKFGLFYKGNFGWVNEAVVVYQYTKTTDAANSFKYADENDYSTTEHIVGSWIDGKPLYQKTIDFGDLPSSATSKTVNHGISNLKEVLFIEAIAINKNDTGASVLLNDNKPGDTTKITRCVTSLTGVIITTGESRSMFKAYVTLRYTKTTD